ncbi:MAG: hypothetical protein ACKERG_04165 [Candidatus Hodgkinia cicadicola]
MAVRLQNCALYLVTLLVAAASFNTTLSFDVRLAADMLLQHMLITGVCVLLNTFSAASCLTSCGGSSEMAAAAAGLALSADAEVVS